MSLDGDWRQKPSGVDLLAGPRDWRHGDVEVIEREVGEQVKLVLGHADVTQDGEL